jgi:hypothetical protein
VNPIIQECADLQNYVDTTLKLNNFEKNKFNDLLESRFYKFKDFPFYNEIEVKNDYSNLDIEKFLHIEILK